MNEFSSSYLYFPECYKVSTMCIIHIITHTNDLFGFICRLSMQIEWICRRHDYESKHEEQTPCTFQSGCIVYKIQSIKEGSFTSSGAQAGF